jgi:hypothetical protein
MTPAQKLAGEIDSYWRTEHFAGRLQLPRFFNRVSLREQIIMKGILTLDNASWLSRALQILQEWGLIRFRKDRNQWEHLACRSISQVAGRSNTGRSNSQGKLSPDELLSMAIVFDAGPPPTHRGKLVPDEIEVPRHMNFRIEARFQQEGQDFWAILSDLGRLSKSGEWEYEPLPSSRTDDYNRRTIFDNYIEAFLFLDQWRELVREQVRSARRKEGSET